MAGRAWLTRVSRAWWLCSPFPGRFFPGVVGSEARDGPRTSWSFDSGVDGGLISSAPEIERLAVVFGVNFIPFLARRWVETRNDEGYGEVWGKIKGGEQTRSGRRLGLYAFPLHTPRASIFRSGFRALGRSPLDAPYVIASSWQLPASHWIPRTGE